MFRKLFRLRIGAAAAALVAIAVLSIPALAHEHRDVGGLTFVVGFLNEPAIEGQPNAASIRITHHADSGSMDMSDGSMEMEHGTLFTSTVMGPGESWDYTFGEDLAGQSIPYHIHPMDIEGTITVQQGAATSGSADVMVMSDHLDPVAMTVAPGTTVTFHNMAGEEILAMNGSLAETEGDAAAADGPPTDVSLQVEIRHIASGKSMTTGLGQKFGEPGHYIANFIPTAPGTYEFRVFGTVDGEDVNETFTGGPTTFSDVDRAADLQFPVQLAASSEVEGAARGAQDSADQASKDANSAGTTATLALVFGIAGTVVGVAGTGLGLWGVQAARKK